MADHTPHQKKIIARYYDHRDNITLNRLGEIVTELTLAETDKKRDRLWQRVAAAMKTLDIKPALAEHILAQRDEQILARNLRAWLGGKPGGR